MIAWLSENIIEIFGAITGVAYVVLEIRRNILLWPLGIITSAVYIYVFGTSGFYANMGLQVYYLLISIYGWHKWNEIKGTITRVNGSGGECDVKRIDRKTTFVCFLVSIGLWVFLWFVLDRWTDSPVPLWDALITSLSVVATWMLTRKLLEQWYVWILADTIAVIVYISAGLYATAALFAVYTVMAVIGVRTWSMACRAQGAVQTMKSNK